MLNLTRRDGYDRSDPLEPGRRYAVRLKLNDLGERIPAGWRLRLALSNAWFPLIWPSPEPVTLTVFAGAASLTLPVRPPRDGAADLAEFAPATVWPSLETTEIRAGHDRRRIETEVATGEVVETVERDGGRSRIHEIDDLEIAIAGATRSSIRPDDPLSARIEVAGIAELGRGAWQVALRTRTVLTATRDSLVVELDLDAHEGGQRVFSRSWRQEIPRDGV